MPRKYNELKEIVLAAFDGRGWLTPQMVKSLSDFRGTAVAGYLNSLRDWGLLHRRGAYRSRTIVFRISQRGRDRLAWLRCQSQNLVREARTARRAASENCRGTQARNYENNNCRTFGPL
jgi:hypothetical protein